MASPATAIVASTNPFPNDARVAFQSYTQSVAIELVFIQLWLTTLQWHASATR
jgi:hypothetical protein